MVVQEGLEPSRIIVRVLQTPVVAAGPSHHKIGPRKTSFDAYDTLVSARISPTGNPQKKF